MARERLASWRTRHQRLERVLWALHSAWALLSGIAVLVLAHNRYGFLRWIVLFLALTWGSTLVFSYLGGIARTVVSYLTRVMYQETLFFLLPFYFYSTTFWSWNVLYLAFLASLAVLSCFDLLFDRLLREHRPFAVSFFAVVSVSALQLFLPLALRWHIEYGLPLAGAISFLAAVALVQPWQEWLRPRRLLAIALTLAAILGALQFLKALVPPVPLRVTHLRVSATLDPRTLSTGPAFDADIPLDALTRHRLYAVATVFAPRRLPAHVQMRFLLRGKVLRTSRNLDLTAKPDGFRMWDSVHLPAQHAEGRYRIEVWSAGQLLGARDVMVVRPSGNTAR